MSDGQSTGGIDHPIRRGAILRRESEKENVERLVSVEQRLQDIDDGYYYYELCCPTLTGYYSYGQEDVEDVFSDTGITHEGVEHRRKPIEDDRVQELYERLCDHRWHAVHDPETMEKDGFMCGACHAHRDEITEPSTTDTDRSG